MAWTICTSVSLPRLNSGERNARAIDKSCCGETSTSSKATMSSTSQQSISSVFSLICAGICSARSSSSSGIRPARRRDNTIKLLAPTLFTSCNALPPEGAHFSLGRPGGKTLAPPLPAARGSLFPEGAELAGGGPSRRLPAMRSCSAIHAAAWRASSVRKVSSGNSRGVVRLSRHPLSSTPVMAASLLFADRAICGSRTTLPGAAEAVVCSRNPSKPSMSRACAIAVLTVAVTERLFRRV